LLTRRTEARDIYLSEQLTDAELRVLAEVGLRSRFPGAVAAWEQRNRDADGNFKVYSRTWDAEIRKKLQDDRLPLEIALEALALRKARDLYR